MPPVQSPVSCLFLASCQQYNTCQIFVPDIEKPLAAIAIGDQYYSFFRSVQDSHRALSMMTRLSYCGDRVAVKKNPKGYGIWVEELDAAPRSRLRNTHHPSTPPIPAPSTMLISKSQYKELQILVPDLDQPLAAIAHNGRYFSLFRIETDTEKVITIITKTAMCGDETVVFRTADGYAICVIEPDAMPIG